MEEKIKKCENVNGPFLRSAREYKKITADDLSGGGSERFIDANVAWGDEKAIRARIQEHWDAGADHVCIQPIRLDGEQQKLDERVLKLLAPAPPKG